MSTQAIAQQSTAPAPLLSALARTREMTLTLVRSLSDADATVQSMDDASPAKWHLAHTTWFFEEFVLQPHVQGYRVFHERYSYLFNSYYETVGARHPRPRRGMLTRPSLQEIKDYRAHVDATLSRINDGLAAEILPLLELGLNHEQQHQELLLTDILHLFSQNPLNPAYHSSLEVTSESGTSDLRWVAFDGGRFEVGHAGPEFAFDCESPRHAVLLRPYALASRPVTQADWLAFIDDGGYASPGLWLSDGWATVQREQWRAPLYWRKHDGAWWQMTLNGERSLNLEAPVTQVSFFEADAYARWAHARLPTEFEWEVAAQRQAVKGHFLGSGRLCPRAALQDDQQPLTQLYGDAWEWTASPYVAYPGFRVAPGAVGEYNGKFMNGQYVLRGGSCVTPDGHTRASYRNFFYPHQRWQFTGLRLAKDMT